MKKLMIALALVSMSSAAMAQESEVPQKKYSVATNNFWSNWFISVGADYHAAYSDQEYGYGLSTNPFRKFRGSWGGDVAIGKWFSPGLGLRVKGYYGQIKQVNGSYATNSKDPIAKKYSRDFGYVAPEAMLNLSNIFCGYNPKRVWNFIVYGGVAGTRDFSDDTYSFAPIAGVMSTWRLSKHFNFNIEAFGMIGEDNIDGLGYQDLNGKRAPKRGGWKAHDRLVGASVGFTYNLGNCTWDNTPDVDAMAAMYEGQLSGLNGQVNDLRGQLNASQQKINSLNQQLQDCLNRKPVVDSRPATDGIESMVLFRCDKSVVDAAQMPNVERVATYMQSHADTKVSIKGYASQEGPAAHNQALSVRRANAVKNLLIKKYGISASRITAEGMGVSTMFPGLAPNRVSISTVK